MNDYPTYILKYIEYKSQIDCNITDTAFCKEVDMSRQGLYQYLCKHPEIEELIASNLHKQITKLGNKALKELYNRISKSDKALQIALEMSNLYITKTESINKYESMPKTDLIKDIHRQINTILKPTSPNSICNNDTHV
jgi:hypothetical protein